MMRTLKPLENLGSVLATWAPCLLLLQALSAFPGAANAARIEVIADATTEHPALILIEGQFLKSEAQHDITTFAELAAVQKKPAIVFLDSKGGMTWTGLRIGKVIQGYGFSTAVADG